MFVLLDLLKEISFIGQLQRFIESFCDHLNPSILIIKLVSNLVLKGNAFLKQELAEFTDLVLELLQRLDGSLTLILEMHYLIIFLADVCV